MIFLLLWGISQPCLITASGTISYYIYSCQSSAWRDGVAKFAQVGGGCERRSWLAEGTGLMTGWKPIIYIYIHIIWDLKSVYQQFDWGFSRVPGFWQCVHDKTNWYVALCSHYVVKAYSASRWSLDGDTVTVFPMTPPLWHLVLVQGSPVLDSHQAAAQAKKQGATGLIIRCEQVRDCRDIFGSTIFMNIYDLHSCIIHVQNVSCLRSFTAIHAFCQLNSRCFGPTLTEILSPHQALSVEKLAACLELRISTAAMRAKTNTHWRVSVNGTLW